MLQVYRARSLVILAALVSFILFWWVGAWIGFPSRRVPAAGLLEQPTFLLSVGSLIATGILLTAAWVVGFGIARHIRQDAALFAACAGMAAMSIRGGDLGELFLSGATPAVYLMLLLEAAILFAMIFGVWMIQQHMNRRVDLPPDSARDGCPDTDEPLGQKLSAALATALAMLVVLGLFAQSEDKAQVICAVGIAALVGATIAHTLFPVRPSLWYWIAPLLVAAVGYIVAFAWPQGWQIGLVRGQFAALARPLPLDYAGAGTAGALLGYWLSRQWQASRHAEERGESET